VNDALVLHWWCNNPSIKPPFDPFNPVVLTVACVRANNPRIPIYVVDVSDCDRPDSDWDYFPYKLDFKVIRKNSFLREWQNKFSNLYDLKLFSRVWDVELSMRSIPQDRVIYMDTDIFCLHPLLPMSGADHIEHFYASYNNGVWIYDKRSANCKYVFDAWKGMLCRALHDDDFRREIFLSNHNYGTFTMQDEIVYRTLCQRMQNHIRPVSMYENFLFYWLFTESPETVKDIKGLHCLSFIAGRNRHNLFLVIRELWDTINRVLSWHDLERIFGGRFPGEMINLKDFYYNWKTVEKFARLAQINSEMYKCLSYHCQETKQHDGVRLRFL
jgi:hypothetical protein